MALSRPQKTGLWIGVAAESEPAAEGPRGADTMTVTVAGVSQRLLEDRVTTTGTLLPWEAVEVRAEVAGCVVGINFREGAGVGAGQVLVTLDTDVFLAQIEGARVRRDLARTQAGRFRELFEIGGLSRQELDQAEAEARCRRIVAPFSGTIGLWQASVGAYLSPGDVVAALRVTGRLRLEFTDPERYLGQIRHGQAVRFAVPGQEDDFVATVYATEPFVDPATRAFTVRAEVRNPGGVLQPGAFAEVRLVLDEIPEALLIPTASAITGADSTTVFVVRDGAAVPTAVTTGVRTADEIQVTSGLAAGDLILTSGLNQVRPGQAVRTGGAFDPTRVRPAAAPRRRSRCRSMGAGLLALAGGAYAVRRLRSRA